MVFHVPSSRGRACRLLDSCLLKESLQLLMSPFCLRVLRFGVTSEQQCCCCEVLRSSSESRRRTSVVGELEASSGPGFPALSPGSGPFEEHSSLSVEVLLHFVELLEPSLDGPRVVPPRRRVFRGRCSVARRRPPPRSPLPVREGLLFLRGGVASFLAGPIAHEALPCGVALFHAQGA